MAYCAECGVYYTEDRATCSSCGRDLKQECKPEIETTSAANIIGPQYTGKTDPDENPAMPPLDAPAGVNVSMSGINPAEDKKVDIAYSQADGHLGKGIIKPQKVESSVDGVHFKYDTPAHDFVKAEPIREKPREYRVTDSDMEFKTIDGINTAKDDEASIPSVQEKAEAVAKVESPLVPAVSQEEPIHDHIAAEDDLLENETVKLPEPVIPDFIAEPELVGPETAIPKDTVVIWEAGQTLFTIPLGNIYRVTGRSLIVCDKFDNRLLEVSLALITGVSVRQSWLAKLFGVGNLLISLTEFSAPKLVLNGIKEPVKAKQVIEGLIMQLTG